MELSDYFKLWQRYRRRLAIIFLVTALAAYGVAKRLPTVYLARGTILVGRPSETGLSEFTFEGYYAQQTAESATETVRGMLLSWDLGAAVLAEPGEEVNSVSRRIWSRRIKTRIAGPQLIELVVKDTNQSRAISLWEGLYQQTANQLVNLDPTTQSPTYLHRLSSTPLTETDSPQPYLSALVGGGLSLVLAYTTLVLAEYRRKQD